MGSIGAKKPCPSGEQIVNGGFETGDFTGWTVIDTPVIRDATWATPYEGNYCAELADTGVFGGVAQTFLESIPSTCFKDTSVFEVHLRGNREFSPPKGSKANIYIVYTDDSETQITWEASGAFVWEAVDLKNYVEAGKTVKGIRIYPVVTGFYVRLDGCSLIP
jgi:hypothetical protein